MSNVSQYGVCRICGCTDDDPCYNPDAGLCWWADDTHTICSHCAESSITEDPRTEHCVRKKHVLDLVLKHKWYDMIASGVKKEEYRDQSEYWYNRLRGFKGNCYVPYTMVRFRRGYTKISMTFKVEDILIGIGNAEWGASGRMQYIIKLGNRII